MIKYVYIILLLFLYACSESLIDPVEADIDEEIQSPPIEPHYPIPSKAQLEWQNAEKLMFIHFGINTFTGKEWGDGTEDPALFNPSKLNAKQWVKVAKVNGFDYVILTAKHHDGFCLWPSKYTEHSIENSPYKNGSGDIVKEFADACKEYGVKFSFYLSPWDRHEKTYGSEEYNLYYQKQLIELLSNYGEVGEVWLDGANGEGPEGKKQEYNRDLIYSTIRYYQPDALIANMGPDIRWVGNEEGLSSETEWSVQPRRYSIQHGNYYNEVWYPSECDVSIRPGWFYHPDEDSEVKNVDKLVEIYFKSVGRNSNLLLNIPPNKDGLISDVDVNRLEAFTARLNQIFEEDVFFNQKITSSNYRNKDDGYAAANCIDNNRNTFWVTDKGVKNASIEISLSKKENINIIRLEEAIDYGQRIKSFEVYYNNNNSMEKIFEGTTIGRSRIITFDEVNTDKIKIVITDSFASPTLRTVSGFYDKSINQVIK